MDFRYCQHCKVKSYARIDNFKRHETVCFANPNRINFFCDVCGKKFVRKDNLNTHLSKLHQHPKVPTFNNEITSQLDKYLNNAILNDKLFSVKILNKKALSLKQTIYNVSLTNLAKSICHAGYMYNIMSDVMEYVMEHNNFRKSSNLCQLVIENVSFDYPISSGLVLGKELDVNNILNRVSNTAQSVRVNDITNNEIIFSVIQSDIMI